MVSYEKKVNINGTEVKVIEWAERFFSIQVDVTKFEHLLENINPTNAIEQYIEKEKKWFYKKDKSTMELAVNATSPLYRELIEEKKQTFAG